MLTQHNVQRIGRFFGLGFVALAVAGTFAPIESADAQEPPLAYAVAAGDVDLVEYLVARGDDLEVLNENGLTPLQVAARRGNAEIVLALVEQGARVDPNPSRPRQSPLRLATEAGHCNVVACLLANGADSAPQRWPASFPLYIAVENEDYEMAQLLLERSSADVNTVVEGCPHDSPLDMAIDSGDLRMIALLLRHGGDVDRVDIYHLVRSNNDREESAEVLDLLAIDGMDINRPFGLRPPLHRAAGHGAVNVIETLLRHGADVNATDEVGDTALHVAARSNQVDAIESLLTHGADANARNDVGWTPLDMTPASSPIAACLRQHVDQQQP